MLDQHAHYCASQKAVACRLGSGTALLNLETNSYFTLNPVGTFVWDRLQEAQSIIDLRAALVGAYAVDESRCEIDLAELMADLTEAGLVERSDAPAG